MIIAASSVAVMFLIFFAIWVFHRVSLAWEAKKNPAPGKLVEVNGKRMHVFAQGKPDAAQTMVFLAGSGTACPYLDFKRLTLLLSGEYRTVVPERFGYGYSDGSRRSRAVADVLEDTRAALLAAGEKPPYILVPHSMAALEALLWAKKHPGEVRAIYGLDPGIPPFYEAMDKKQRKSMLRMCHLMHLMAALGIHRLIPAIWDPCADGGKDVFIMSERACYKTAVMRSFLSGDTVREGQCVCENARTVTENGLPLNTPVCFFISDGKELNTDNWQEMQINFLKPFKKMKCYAIEGGHYVHNLAPELIAEAIKAESAELPLVK